MSYDHHKKAGNQGDVVKHVAVVAALDTTLQDWNRADFRYADTFAGYAYSPLIKGNEWNEGIENVFGKGEQLKQNPHTKLWYEWYLQGRHHLLGGVYPGSSLIANDVCRLHKKRPRLALWDISPAVIANLMETYWAQGHRIHGRPSSPKSKAIKSADFVFIDPPGLQTPKERSYPAWQDVRRFLEQRPEGQSVMVWLPVKAVTSKKINGKTTAISPPEEDRASQQAREDAKQLGFRTVRVRWSTGGRTVGCLLMCQISDAAWTAMDDAIRHVAGVAGWQAKLDKSLQAIES